jgi:hypothetical protein
MFYGKIECDLWHAPNFDYPPKLNFKFRSSILYYYYNFNFMSNNDRERNMIKVIKFTSIVTYNLLDFSLEY